VITDGVDGLLVPPADPQALMGAITRLAANEELRRRIAADGYQTVRERFSIDSMVRRVEEVYDEELTRSGALARINAEGPPAAAAGGASPADRGAREVPPL
ncbi:MAG: glycosyltransferase, partial [Chloroflexota bacterium]